MNSSSCSLIEVELVLLFLVSRQVKVDASDFVSAAYCSFAFNALHRGSCFAILTKLNEWQPAGAGVNRQNFRFQRMVTACINHTVQEATAVVHEERASFASNGTLQEIIGRDPVRFAPTGVTNVLCG